MTKLTPHSVKMGGDYLAREFATFFFKFTGQWIYFTLNTMPCPSTCPKMFWDSPVFFWARQKTALYLVPLKKMLCQHEN